MVVPEEVPGDGEGAGAGGLEHLKGSINLPSQGEGFGPVGHLNGSMNLPLQEESTGSAVSASVLDSAGTLNIASEPTIKRL
ncbi:MAG: hypothetical protein KME17_21860 [Cyanosarcina radialis HA8281-LM2]|nr:hypothetical protein [Cyanosarcina radialis HA8281-LM2]